MGLARHFFSSGSRQEVNSTWYPEIEEPIKSREKHYSLVLYILILVIVWMLVVVVVVFQGRWFYMAAVMVVVVSAIEVVFGGVGGRFWPPKTSSNDSHYVSN